MHTLARELRAHGYERTERESPFHDDGQLWTNSYELVCDRTAAVIRKDEPMSRITGENENETGRDDSWPTGDRHSYQSTKVVKMAGGYTGSYDWGPTEDGFEY